MRIAGITVPDTKNLEIALTSVYGVGRAQARRILDVVGVAHTTKPTELTPDQESSIRQEVESLTIEGELRREIAANVKRLKDINAYRGMRHNRRLPVKGQRTKTNARTRKGVKKTMGTGRKKVEKK